MSKLKTFSKYLAIVYLISLALFFFRTLINGIFPIGEPSSFEIILNRILGVNVSVFLLLSVLMFIFGLIDLFHQPRNVSVIIPWIISIISVLYFAWGFFAIWLFTSMFQGV